MKNNYEKLRKEIIPVFEKEISANYNYNWFLSLNIMTYIAEHKKVSKKEYDILNNKRYKIVELAEELYTELPLSDYQYVTEDCDILQHDQSELKYKKEVDNVIYAIVSLTIGPEINIETATIEEMECVGLDSTIVYVLLKIEKEN